MDASTIPLAVYSPEEFNAFEALEQGAASILASRMEGFQVPRLRFEPTDDDILVFRLPSKERRTKGGIIVPTFSKDKAAEGYGQEVNNEVVVDVGILLKAGNAARDWMRSHGVFLGDYIRFGHYAGREQSSHIFDVVHEIDGDLKDFLQLKVQDIRGSFDLDWRVNGDAYKDKSGEQKTTAPVIRRAFVHDGQGNGLTVFKPIAGAGEK